MDTWPTLLSWTVSDSSPDSLTAFPFCLELLPLCAVIVVSLVPLKSEPEDAVQIHGNSHKCQKCVVNNELNKVLLWSTQSCLLNQLLTCCFYDLPSCLMDICFVCVTHSFHSHSSTCFGIKSKHNKVSNILEDQVNVRTLLVKWVCL